MKIKMPYQSLKGIALAGCLMVVIPCLAVVQYRAICIPPTAQSLQGIDQQLMAEGLYDVAYSTVDGSRIYFRFSPGAIATYSPVIALQQGTKTPTALIISGFNKQIFIINNQDQYPFVAKLFNQTRGTQQGAPLKPAKSLTELNALGITFTKLTNMQTLLNDARAALAW